MFPHNTLHHTSGYGLPGSLITTYPSCSSPYFLSHTTFWESGDPRRKGEWIRTSFHHLFDLFHHLICGTLRERFGVGRVRRRGTTRESSWPLPPQPPPPNFLSLSSNFRCGVHSEHGHLYCRLRPRHKRSQDRRNRRGQPIRLYSNASGICCQHILQRVLFGTSLVRSFSVLVPYTNHLTLVCFFYPAGL